MNSLLILKPWCSLCPHSNAIHTRCLQRPHQPISDWLQEHPHYDQHGVTELRRRVAEEEAWRRRRLRRFMTLNAMPPLPLLYWPIKNNLSRDCRRLLTVCLRGTQRLLTAGLKLDGGFKAAGRRKSEVILNKMNKRCDHVCLLEPKIYI